jgi:hypothetical protein
MTLIQTNSVPINIARKIFSDEIIYISVNLVIVPLLIYSGS